MRIVVTGASGFVGGHVVKALVEAGHEVTCIVREMSDRTRLQPLGVGFAIADVTDAESLRPAFAGAEAVIHLAALLKVPWRATFIDDNVAGAAAVCDAVAAQPTPPVLIYCSSIAATGPAGQGRARVETDEPAPVSRYGRAKMLSEARVRSYADRLAATIVRPPMVMGEHDWASLPLYRMAQRGLFVAPRVSARKLSIVDVQDLAAVMAAVVERGQRVVSDEPSRGAYFLCSDEHPTFPELGAMLGAATGGNAPFVLRIPGPLTQVAAAMGELIGRVTDKPTVLNLDKAAEGLAGHWWCSSQRAVDGLGWHPRPLADTLGRTAAWYRDQQWL